MITAFSMLYFIYQKKGTHIVGMVFIMGLYCVSIRNDSFAEVELFENGKIEWLGTFGAKSWREFRCLNDDSYEVLGIEYSNNILVITLVRL